MSSKLFKLSALACCAAACFAAAGCRGTLIDVAKGRPNENDITDIQSDYQSKPPSGMERFSPENITKSMKKAVGLGPNQKKASQYFDDGEQLFAEKKYGKAVGKFKSASGSWPDSTLQEDAMFLQAESYFFEDHYSAANDCYGELMKKYPNTRHLDKTVARQYAIARYWQDKDFAHHRWTLVPNFTDRTQPLFDTGGHAVNTYDNVRVNDPRGPLADSAIMAEANIFFQQHRYEDADYYYALLRTDYPKSKFQLQAHLLGLQCKLLKYQGPGYNGKPLEEAEQIIDQTLAQFTPELGDERDRLVKAKAEVRAQRATRDIQLAQYWDKGEHYGAAKIYYAQVLKQYPQTPFSEQAKTRLAEIEAKPNNPPNRLAFLTDWMEPPENRSTYDDDRRDTFVAQKNKNDSATPPVSVSSRDVEAEQADAAGRGPVQR